MIREKIKKDIIDEFLNLKEALQIHLKPGFDVPQTKQFLKTHIPKEIVNKSVILLDTLLNYLMEDARERIKVADLKIQNAFYDADFRKRVHEWVSRLESKLVLEPDMVKFTADQRLKQSLIASGVTFAATGIILSFASDVIQAMVSGIITILLSAAAFKLTFDKETHKARETIKRDIDQYIKTSEKQIIEWLEKVSEVFELDFKAFCSTHGFTLEGKPNE